MIEVVQIAWPKDKWSVTDRLAVEMIGRRGCREKAEPDKHSDDPAFHHVCHNFARSPTQFD
jgi:hypothetical protein